MIFTYLRTLVSDAVLAGVYDALKQLGLDDQAQAAHHRAAARELLALLGKPEAPGLPVPSENHAPEKPPLPIALPEPATDVSDPSIHEQVAGLKALLESGPQPQLEQAAPKRGPGRPKKGSQP